MIYYVMLLRQLQQDFAFEQKDFFSLPIVWKKFMLIFHISRVSSGNLENIVSIIFDIGPISTENQSWIQEIFSALDVEIHFARPDTQDNAYSFMIGLDTFTERLATHDPFSPYADLSTFIGEQFVRDLLAAIQG